METKRAFLTTVLNLVEITAFHYSFVPLRLLIIYIDVVDMSLIFKL